ncbi:MAG: hypothetical protein WC843_02895 [Candidatus Gracilibacteria bacterium]|jgi:hypothetical protein
MLEIRDQVNLIDDNRITNKQGSEVSSDAIINCEFEHAQNSAVLRASDIQSKILSVIGFTAKEKPTEVGLEIIKSALIAAMIGKFRQSMIINLDFDLDPRSFEFIGRLSSGVIGSLDDARPPLVTARTLTELHPDPVTAVPNQIVIGNSGGRDSFVSAEILKACGFDLRDYKIDYDKKNPTDNADYSTYEHDVCRNGLDGRYEPFDISMTYFASLWNVEDRVPQHIAIGHSFDVLGFNSNRRRAPYESPMAMELHQKYLESLLGPSVSFTYPLATLSTYSVFEYIRRKFGLAALESRVSCWNSENASDCGYCDKCQRIKLASTAMHLKGYEYLREMPQVIDTPGYLFGNPLYDKLVAKYGKDVIAESQLFSKELPFNPKVAEYLDQRYSGRYQTVDSSNTDQSLNFVGDREKMSAKLGVDYSALPADHLNDDDRVMPYEQYFGRRVPTIASHGEIPQFVDGLGWIYQRVCDGPRLEVPDSLLFRRFFNKK